MNTQTKERTKLSESSKAQLQEAEQFYSSGNYVEAISKYQEVLGNNPEYIPALNKLASSYRRSNNVEQAITFLERITQLNPNNDKAHAKLARIQANKGDMEKAVIGYKKAISINQEQPDWAFIGLGKALRSLQKSS